MSWPNSSLPLAYMQHMILMHLSHIGRMQPVIITSSRTVFKKGGLKQSTGLLSQKMHAIPTVTFLGTIRPHQDLCETDF